MRTAIHWFRRDLRLTDNTALNAAIADSDAVVPVYVVSTWKNNHRWTGPARQDFLCGCLQSLDSSLRSRGGRLLVRQGPADQVIEKLLIESKAQALHFNRDPDPFGREMEARVATVARQLGVSVHAHQDHALHERTEVMTGSGTPFRVFTPYSRAWLKLPKRRPAPPAGPVRVPAALGTDPLPTLAHWGWEPRRPGLEPGEAAARKRMNAFLSGPVFQYGRLRDIPGVHGTSRLSQDLRHGLISIRELYQECENRALHADPEQRRGVGTYINELIWREFYFQVLWHWPEVLNHEFQEKFRALKWHRSQAALDRWCRGETGFPIVDAGMRELATTGFMHNRVRMITAMFLVKDLHLSWKEGEQWFMSQLLDGEIASNNGGWQWSAGTGTDAAPYFRIQNPWSQTAKFDPEGTYIQKWVPELAGIDPAKFSQPPAPGLSVSRGYPAPIVEHSKERDVTLGMYRV
jgi:deoxyribodipyrimidine photo-lyase